MKSQALAGLYMPTFGAGDLQGPSGFYAICGTAPNWTMSMHASWCENESKSLFVGNANVERRDCFDFRKSFPH